MKLYKHILRHSLVESFLIILGVFILKVLKFSIPFDRVGFDDADKRTRENKGNIYAFWHGRMLMMPFVYRGSELHVLISLHSDGSLVSKVMKRFNIHSVRGSSFRRSVGALKEMQRLVNNGKDVVFTPDGPRGPNEVAQKGVLFAAKLGGVPIFPVSFSTSRLKFLSTWDKFLIPFPFSKGIFMCGEGIVISRDADICSMEESKKKLEKSLIELGKKADNYFDSEIVVL